VDAIIYMIDAYDRERFPEAKAELEVRSPPGGLVASYFGFGVSNWLDASRDVMHRACAGTTQLRTASELSFPNSGE